MEDELSFRLVREDETVGLKGPWTLGFRHWKPVSRAEQVVNQKSCCTSKVRVVLQTSNSQVDTMISMLYS